jgi:hypothetical protein
MPVKLARPENNVPSGFRSNQIEIGNENIVLDTVDSSHT